MSDLAGQQVLNGSACHPPRPQDPAIDRDAIRLRASLDEVYWHCGRLRFHQAEIEKHLTDVERAMGEVEDAFDLIMARVTKETSKIPESQTERRESYSTAMSRPPSISDHSTHSESNEDESEPSESVTPANDYTHPTQSRLDPPAGAANELQANNMVSIPTSSGGGLIQSFPSSSTSPTFAYSVDSHRKILPSFTESISAPPPKSQAERTTSPTRSARRKDNTASPTMRTKTKKVQSTSPRKNTSPGAYLVLNGLSGSHRVYTSRMEANIGRGKDMKYSYVIPFVDAEQAGYALEGCIRSKLCKFLEDTKYEDAWFSVLNAATPTYCQRDELVASIGANFLSKLKEDDIVVALTEAEAENAFQFGMGLYVD
ncbi:hypothetical protein VNI00_008678 [Paramarasmius palmivorus]|uniref:Uncharacterized protein n=1 Tax=Paramarasmius palmivorus TaxID=297713 RepID=A0AAW0CVZ7_9AGAR